MSLPEAASQSLAVLSALAVRIRAPSGLNAASIDPILMVKGGDQLARGRIPELGGVVRARRQDPSTVRTKRRMVDAILMAKEAMSLPEAASQSLAVLSALAVRIRAPSGLNAASLTSS